MSKTNRRVTVPRENPRDNGPPQRTLTLRHAHHQSPQRLTHYSPGRAFTHPPRPHPKEANSRAAALIRAHNGARPG